MLSNLTTPNLFAPQLFSGHKSNQKQPILGRPNVAEKKTIAIKSVVIIVHQTYGASTALIT